METKKWYQSLTIWGAVLTALPIIAGWFGVQPQALPESADQILQLLGLIIVTIGRARANKPLG
jgi:Mg2+ and Co2+ transporter CorA